MHKREEKNKINNTQSNNLHLNNITIHTHTYEFRI